MVMRAHMLCHMRLCACVCAQEMPGIISNETIWADLYEMVLDICAGRAIINPRAFPFCSPLSFHAPDLRVWISHHLRQANSVTGWTTWKKYTELHKESSQSLLPSSTSLFSPSLLGNVEGQTCVGPRFSTRAHLGLGELQLCLRMVWFTWLF